jgi:hypothetical protein
MYKPYTEKTTNGIENEAFRNEHPNSSKAPKIEVTRLTSISPVLLVKWTNSFTASAIAKAKTKAKLYMFPIIEATMRTTKIVPLTVR